MPEKCDTLTVADFQSQFLTFHSKLKSFIFRLTANWQDAEDIANDTYIKALKNLGGFSGKSTLKTWLFTIATNLAKDRLRAQQRWHADIQDQCRESAQASPEKVQTMRDIVHESPAEKYEFKEHIDYCFTCIAKTLETAQQLVLILKEVYQFKVAEIMEIASLSEGQVKYRLSEARRTMTAIYDRRCTLVSKTGICYQCAEMSEFVNPEQDATERMEALNLVKEARGGASKRRLFNLRTELVSSVDPLAAPASKLHAYLLSLMPEHAPGDPHATR